MIAKQHYLKRVRTEKPTAVFKRQTSLAEILQTRKKAASHAKKRIVTNFDMFDCIHRTSDLTVVPDKTEHQLRVLSKEGTPYVIPDDKILLPT